MEAHAARSEPASGRWRHALESRRVLAPLLIAPAVDLHGARRRRALRLGDLPQLHGRDRRLADRPLGRLRQLHDRLARRQLPPRAPEHAHLHARVAGDRRRRRGGAVELPRPRLSRQVDRALPRRSCPGPRPVVLSTITWLWLLDSLYSVAQLDARAASTSTTRSSGCSARSTSRRAPRFRCSGSVARTSRSLAITIVHAWRILPFAVVIFIAGRASIPTEVEDASQDRRRDGPEEALVRRRPAAAPDRARRGALRNRVHRSRLRASSTSSPTAGRSTRPRSCRPGPMRSGSTRARSARAPRSRCSSSRCSSSSAWRCCSSRGGRR